jgi:hypothetical protein
METTQKIQWEDDLDNISSLIKEAEETNVVYDLKSDGFVKDSGPASVITLDKVGVSDDGQTIPMAANTNLDTGVVDVPPYTLNQTTLKDVQSLDKKLSETAKKNLMIFGAGLGLFLLLRKK